MKPMMIAMTVACALTASFAAPTLSASAQEIQLKASLFLPPSNALVKGMEKWAEVIKDKSAGRLVIKLFPGGQMGPPPRQFDLVRTGVADIAVILHGATPGRFPVVELAHLPGLVKGNYSGALGLSEIASDVFGADHPGVRILNVVVARTVIISRSQINDTSDLKGKRIRAAGSVQSNVLEALGAVPTAIQPGDLNDALSKGMIEGVSIGYTGIDSYKLEDAGKFIAEGDMGSISFATIMNQASYNNLPADLRKIIDETSGVAGARIFGKIFADDETSAKNDLLKKGVKITQMTDRGGLLVSAAKINEQAGAKAEGRGSDARGAVEKIKAATAKYASED